MRLWSMKSVPLVLLSAVGVAVAACGGDGGQAEAGAAEAAPEVTAEMLAQVATDYATDLGVTLSEMTKTESGLHWKDVLVGEGETAAAGQRVKAHYTGWLPDGTMFDSSMDGDDPIEFNLGAGELIRGWDEGVVGMNVGGRRRLVIPPGLAYGAEGRGPIPAMSTLVFDIQLVEIVK